MKPIIKLLSVLLLVLYAQVAFAPTPNLITSCGFATSSSGTYLVTQDLAYTTGNCITISHPGVTLDCQGYRLTGTGVNTGIYAGSAADGAIIRNCDVYDFNYGIYLYYADDSTVEYNKAVDNSYGITLRTSNGSVVRWNKGDDNSFALYVFETNDSDIYENTLHRSANYGVYCYGGTGNDFIANQLNRNSSYGMYMYGCDNGNIWHNTVNLNSNGVRVTISSTGNDFYKNVFNRNDFYGIYDYEGGDTTNSYDGNVCKNNGTAASSPTELCK